MLIFAKSILNSAFRSTELKCNYTNSYPRQVRETNTYFTSIFKIHNKKHLKNTSKFICLWFEKNSLSIGHIHGFGGVAAGTRGEVRTLLIENWRSQYKGS